MGANSGKPYEKLTQRVFQSLHHTQGPPVTVQHNVVLQSVVGKHQIDVYWSLERAGISYGMVVQCKDWANPVDQGAIHTLQTVLDDLPGQPRGAMVGRSGFQEGTKTWALKRASSSTSYDRRRNGLGGIRYRNLEARSRKRRGPICGSSFELPGTASLVGVFLPLSGSPRPTAPGAPTDPDVPN
jgi:hypothetical protein